ncbi:hypothetical protein ACHAXA_011857 [Cyclostephanos tholiformis]|uniref:C2H2-type domain-containing protein n=1 Tax=Cyclostephanos tholiformis TaxID=382380 RepID=A0ABD3RNH5_9STRA
MSTESLLPVVPTAPSASTGETSSSPPPPLTSTTAPGKIFASRSELKEHYRSDWHRYNLRRREAGLNMLNESDFRNRLDAAMSLRKEKDEREERNGMGHIKHRDEIGRRSGNGGGGGDQKGGRRTRTDGGGGGGDGTGKRNNSRRRKPAFAADRGGITMATTTTTTMMMDEDDAVANDGADVDALDGVVGVEGAKDVEAMGETMEEGPPEINPNQSLFDNKISSNPETNLSYMKMKYSFFLPDYDCLVDLEGFLGYCNEKVRWGNTCLCCQRTFSTHEGTMKHMRDKRHCRILYERGVDMEEYDVFYDYSRMGMEGEGGGEGDDDDDDDVVVPRKKAGTRRIVGNDAAMEGKDEEEEEEEWEDVSDEDDASMDNVDEDDDEDDDDLYDVYEREINTRGIDITPLGELIFPDGRIVGHRALARYYRQRYAPDRMERAAVRHARMAADDRLYNGRVVNLHRLHDGGDVGGGGGGGKGGGAVGTSAALTVLGRTTTSSSSSSFGSMIPPGRRDGGGILVPEGSGGGKGGYTSLSLYRYRAAIKKQRREDDRGRRLQYRSRMNMNKMNKKGNNIATGVVTSHMPR